MLALTESAIAAVRSVVAGDEAVQGLRIAAASGGCSGLRYMMGLEIEEQDGDTVLRFDDVTVYVDSDSLPLLAGAEVDFVDGDNGAGFVFNNPNAVGKSCGCGKTSC